ncbi:MAG: Rrf2 family transcriptional regulator [Planctomycetota bacterium]
MISQTAEYALRAMACLAYYPDKLTPTPALAEQTKVPANYLAKVLQVLSSADLINGRRGVGGGYRLAKPARDISLLDVIESVDKVERIKTCPLDLPNHGSTLCTLHKKMDEVAATVIDLFGSMSLEDLVTESAPSLPLCDAKMTQQLQAEEDADLTINRARAAQPLHANGHNGHTNGNGNGHHH